VTDVFAYQPPDDAADLLPGAWYATAEPAEVTPRHSLLGFTVLVIGVGASLAAPVAGIIAVTAVITVLRAAGRATERLAARRRTRGPRRRDPFVLLASVPPLLAWAVVETAVLAPLMLAAAAIVVALAIKAIGGGHPALAAAAVASGYAVLACLGPGSRTARRQLNRFVDPIARSPLTAGLVTLVLGAVAVGVIALTVPGKPAFWPVHDWRGALVRLTGTQSGECLPPPPDMRLTTLCAAPHGAYGPSPRPTPSDRPRG
jgi:hypothetical protein